MIFPGTEYDDPERLLSFLGSFWSETFEGRKALADLLYAKGRRALQTRTDFSSLLAAVSRFKLQPRRLETWRFVTFDSSARLRYDSLRFDGAAAFADGRSFDEPDASRWAWKLPAGLVEFELALNRVHRSSRALIRGVDYILDGGYVVFRNDPFEDGMLPLVDVLVDGVVADRRCGLWIYRSLWDKDDVWLQYGYAVTDARLPSTASSLRLVNAIHDCLVRGTHQGAIVSGLAAIAGAPIATDADVVSRVVSDRNKTWIICEGSAYSCSRDADPLVSTGERIRKNQILCDAVQVFEFGRGEVPSREALQALAIGREHSAAGYMNDLVFENKDVDLVVETVDGWTKVSFELGGSPADVEKFWEDVHAKGVASGTTLAMLLDSRPTEARTTQPTAKALPKKVNPLRFLAQNVFRNNAFVVKLRPQSFGEDAVGVWALDLLARLLPPHTAMLVVLEAEAVDELDAEETDPGKPGLDETAEQFEANDAAGDSIDGGDSAWVQESVKLFRISGSCR